tara:strand:+ start:1060 stop:2382 length:1323 start_codon:yes stop_codon:yes gene_type:complete
MELLNEPISQEAEQAVLGCIMLDNNSITKIIPFIQTDEAFSHQGLRDVWKLMIKLHSSHTPIDLVTLHNKSVEAGNKNVSASLLASLKDMAPVASNVEFYAKIMWEKYMQREVISSARHLIDHSYNNMDKTQKILDEHEKTIDELKSLQPNRSRTIKDLMPSAIEDMKETKSIIKYDIKALDEFAGGLTRKEITILGGRPGHGKTTLALNIIIKLVEQGYKVMVFNREMSNKSMIEKLIVNQSKLKYSDLRGFQMNEEDIEEFDKACDMLVEGKFAENLLLYDDIRDLSSTMREIYKHKPDIVIDDYIQLIQTDEVNGRRFEIEKILLDYKWMCKKVNCSAIILSQLSREIEKRLDPEPRLSDYAESGVIEQVAEAALFVFYGYNFDHEEYDPYESKIIAAKSRYGRIGSYNLGFNGNKCKFYDDSLQASNDGRDLNGSK